MRKQNRWKKVVSAILSTAMAAGLCVSVASAEEGGYDGEIITLTVMGETGNDGISTDHAIGRYIRDKLGIILEYQVVDTDRLKVLASGGDLPDIVELHNDDIKIETLIDSGALWAMDEWLDDENNGKNLKERLPDALKFAKEIVGDGQTYCIPSWVKEENKDLPSKNGFVGFFTRWDYYKELGYPEMTSEDDYLAVLKQMVENHPETADGKKVYALSGWTDWGLWPYMISYPFSFGYVNRPDNQLYNRTTGELEDMFVEEDGIFWDALSFFNKAYRMGIMDPEAFTMKAIQYEEKVKNGEVLVSAANWQQPDQTICGEEAANYLIPGVFPYAAQIYPEKGVFGYGASNSLVISANCEYPERAMELLDYLNSDEGARLVRSGIQGEDWDYVDGVPQLIGTRLENFLSNDAVEPGYASNVGSQGLGVYWWLSSLDASNPMSDGYPMDLTLSKEYLVENVTAADKDFCNYYTGGTASYPGEAYVQMVEEGKMKVAEPSGLAVSVMKSCSEESSRIFSKASEYFQANIAKIITCEDDEAFQAQKEKMIADVMAMGYESALEEEAQLFEEAKETAEKFYE